MLLNKFPFVAVSAVSPVVTIRSSSVVGVSVIGSSSPVVVTSSAVDSVLVCSKLTVCPRVSVPRSNSSDSTTSKVAGVSPVELYVILPSTPSSAVAESSVHITIRVFGVFSDSV